MSFRKKRTVSISIYLPRGEEARLIQNEVHASEYEGLDKISSAIFPDPNGVVLILTLNFKSTHEAFVIHAKEDIRRILSMYKLYYGFEIDKEQVT